MRFSNLHILLLLTLLTVQPLQLAAQRLVAHRGTVSGGYNYWFYEPASIEQQDVEFWEPERKPLVVFLHGASLCGRNLERVRRYGTIDALTKGLKLDAYVLAPQNPGGPWRPDRINQLIDWALDGYHIDSTRIYVIGMSLGGYGTIDYVATSPERVAAAMALCGGGTVGKYANLCKVPLCILHGTGDRAVPWSSSQAIVDGMLAAGDTSRLIYHLLPRQTHGDLARYFYLPAAYNWLFKHSLNDSARIVNRDFDFTKKVDSEVYTQLSKPDKPIPIVNSIAPAEARAEAAASSAGRVHVVRNGDTLSAIARKYHTTVTRLCTLNGIKRTSTLRLGQKIRY